MCRLAWLCQSAQEWLFDFDYIGIVLTGAIIGDCARFGVSVHCHCASQKCFVGDKLLAITPGNAGHRLFLPVCGGIGAGIKLDLKLVDTIVNTIHKETEVDFGIFEMGRFVGFVSPVIVSESGVTEIGLLVDLIQAFLEEHRTSRIGSTAVRKVYISAKEAYTTDTAYRIVPKEKIVAEKLVYCFINTITALSAELEGRFYGGGVLELVPSEIDRLLVPYVANVVPFVNKLDQAIRNASMEEILEMQDTALFTECGDIDMRDIQLLRKALNRLRLRRQRLPEE